MLDSAALKKLSQKFRAVRWLYEARRVWWHLPPIAQIEEWEYPEYLDYAVKAIPRYGYGKPPHPQLSERLAQNRAAYEELIARFASFREQLRSIPAESARAAEPFWNNGWIHGMDIVTLYCIPALINPGLYIEVGSGNSTMVVRRSVAQNGLRTKMISIDPRPRAEVDGICDQVIRQPLEDIGFEMFDRLESGDILMLDSSHRCFQNSDVTAFFLEVLPRIKPGVVVHIHDIFLPYDYPPEWKRRYYSEQYLLGVLLLADSVRYDVMFPCRFMESDDTLRTSVDRLWDRLAVPARKNYGSSFWMTVTDRR